MHIEAEDVRLYSRNKNIVFEAENQERMVNRLITMIVAKLSRLTVSPSRVVFTERIIEYPLVFQYLDKNCRSILDFGCVEDLLPIHLASLGYNVTGLDFRPYPFTHPNFKFVQADILSWDPPREEYDCAISVSTIEHVGLGGYGDPAKNDGDKIAVAKLLAALKPGGKLIVSVPFGKSTIQRNMRIYNHNMLCELIPNIEVERCFFKPNRCGGGVGWTETTSREMDNLEYEDYYKIAPAQGVAFVVAGKQ
jgi:SAM-dependent methyltransferase